MQLFCALYIMHAGASTFPHCCTVLLCLLCGLRGSLHAHFPSSASNSPELYVKLAGTPQHFHIAAICLPLHSSVPTHSPRPAAALYVGLAGVPQHFHIAAQPFCASFVACAAACTPTHLPRPAAALNLKLTGAPQHFILLPASCLYICQCPLTPLGQQQPCILSL
eukprot:scaffold54680_cov23-Tisochrysis_lutea.AAC.1